MRRDQRLRIDEGAIGRIAKKVQGQSLEGIQGYDKPTLVKRLMQAIETEIEEYLSAYESGSSQEYWDALDTVKAALDELSNEYVQANL